uniref:NADH-ubiquinone oxidoreductase chain 2 n=1 Tax=Modiolus philippinarum TaxID=310899 RepID=A0A1Z2WWV7_9BIVA|nr:NADH dehydrogenase subunit 2 [Modiolus philippinarum]ASB29975.1 NADH dehydrogenase subunit 2 [Modiolus philippinarum]
MMNPLNLISLMVLVLGVMFVLSSDSKLGGWLGMEINVFGFLGVLSMRGDSNVLAGLKYFIIQAIGSMFFLMGVLLFLSGGVGFYNLFMNMSMTCVYVGLFCKGGVFPFHSWVPSVIKISDWLTSWFIMSIQKIGPFFLIASWVSVWWVMVGVVGLSVLGGIGGLNQLSVRGILAYSSLVQSAWMLVALACSQKLFLFYFVSYLIQLSVMILVSAFLSLKNTGSEWLCILGSVVSLSLAGIPPMGGFFMKLMVFLLVPNMSMIIFPILGSIISLGFYIRLMKGFMLGYSWRLNKRLSGVVRLFILFNGALYLIVLSCIL